MSTKQRFAEAIQDFPESITIEEAFERLYRAFQLKRAMQAAEERYHRKPTLKEALGLLATEGPAPSDEQIAAWLGERRMEKHG